MFLVLIIATVLALLLMYAASGPAAETVRRIFVPALVLGLIGFVLGFVGPMIVTPDANQGPMLGIFITGPLGFVLGLLAGGVRELLARREGP